MLILEKKTSRIDSMKDLQKFVTKNRDKFSVMQIIQNEDKNKSNIENAKPKNPKNDFEFKSNNK